MLSKRILTIWAIVLSTFFALTAVAYATDLTWNSATNGEWDVPTNWSGIDPPEFPADGDDAIHDDTFSSRIEVDSDERCDQFTGQGGASGRFLLIESLNTLTVDVDMKNAATGGNYTVKMDNGGSPTATTTLDIGGDMKGMEVVPAPAFGATGNFVTVDVGGSVTGSSIFLSHNASVSSGGSVIDTPVTVQDRGTVTFGAPPTIPTLEVRGGVMTFGTARAGVNDGTAVHIFGSAGTDANKIGEDWNLRGYTDLTVEGDFIMEEPMNAEPLVEQLDQSSVQVHGTTKGGDWHVFDDSGFRAEDAAGVKQRIEGGGVGDRRQGHGVRRGGRHGGAAGGAVGRLDGDQPGGDVQ